MQIETKTTVEGSRITQEILLGGPGSDSMEVIHRKVCNLQEVQLRQALIEMGWTPPDVNEDHKRLVRQLDVALNGEAGAAKQASLCDIVKQVEKEGIAAGENARKGLHWFDTLAKCAQLLGLPDDEPIPSGVLRAVGELQQLVHTQHTPLLSQRHFAGLLQGIAERNANLTEQERGHLVDVANYILGPKPSLQVEPVTAGMTAYQPVRIAGLTFAALRDANTRRLPQYKTKDGRPAHSTQDGSDWCPAQWLQALVGELGEYAFERDRYERGEIDFDTYAGRAAGELADVQCYLDILARRALDKVVVGGPPRFDPASMLQEVIAHLGAAANARKKIDRNEPGLHEYAKQVEENLARVRRDLYLLSEATGPAPRVTEAHPTGVDLGRATADKFNEVSRRVGADVFLSEGL